MAAVRFRCFYMVILPRSSFFSSHRFLWPAFLALYTFSHKRSPLMSHSVLSGSNLWCYILHMFYCNTLIIVRNSPLSACLSSSLLVLGLAPYFYRYFSLSFFFSVNIILGICHAEVSVCVEWWHGFKEREWYSLIGLKSVLLAVGS